MEFNRSPLQPLLEALEKQNTTLGVARNNYLMLEAEKKHFEASIVSRLLGKSYAERLNAAQAQPEWVEFQKKLARAEAVYEFEKLKFSIMEKSWQSEYLSLKLDGAVIKKQE